MVLVGSVFLMLGLFLNIVDVALICAPRFFSDEVSLSNEIRLNERRLYERRLNFSGRRICLENIF